jgi:glycosyltransferase involved in cell wall biosynthesis
MPRPIRICYLIDSLSRAGTETQLLALIRSLDRRRFAPALALLRGDDDLSRRLEPDDCPVLRLGVRSLRSRRALAAAAELTRFWRRERIDLVQTYFLDSTYFGVPLARLTGVRRVVRVRNNLGHWLTPQHRAAGRVIGRVVDATLTNCEPARQAILAAEGGPARKLIVLENGVDIPRYSNLPPPRFPPRRIGAVANLRPIKGVDVFIEAAARLAPRCPDLTFHVAGEGPERSRLEQLIESRGLAGRFHLHGAVADVPEFLGRLDVVTLPSYAEGMSNALLEALAAGRPVIATDVGANAHVLGEGRFGTLVPPGDAAALAQAIARQVSEPRPEQIDAARRHVGHNYSREAMCRRFEAFYQRLCA